MREAPNIGVRKTSFTAPLFFCRIALFSLLVPVLCLLIVAVLAGCFAPAGATKGLPPSGHLTSWAQLDQLIAPAGAGFAARGKTFFSLTP